MTLSRSNLRRNRLKIRSRRFNLRVPLIKTKTRLTANGNRLKGKEVSSFLLIQSKK
jgi:hypothetical protein